MGSPLLIPVDDVEQIVEYAVSAPPPLAQPWVGGLAVLGERLVTSLRLGASPGGEGPRSVKGLWVRRGGTRVGVVVEVERVGAMITAERTGEAATATGFVCPRRWLGEAKRARGDTLLLLEVQAMLADLETTTPDPRGDHDVAAG
jgi:chemotaxis signal transduction protein